MGNEPTMIIRFTRLKIKQKKEAYENDIAGVGQENFEKRYDKYNHIITFRILTTSTKF